MAYADGTADAITTSAWPTGNMARTSPLFRTKHKQPAPGASTFSERGTSRKSRVERLEETSQRAHLALPQSRVCLERAPGCGGQRQQAPLAFGARIAFPARIT